MTTATTVIICILGFIYTEAAITTGVYMYLSTSRQKSEETEGKQLKIFSVAAGVFFPVTLAILAAYRLAERTKK